MSPGSYFRNFMVFLRPKSCEGLCIFTSFYFPDSGLYLSNGFDFYCDLFWMAWHWKPAIGCNSQPLPIKSKNPGNEVVNPFYPIYLVAKNPKKISGHVRNIESLSFWQYSEGDFSLTLYWVRKSFFQGFSCIALKMTSMSCVDCTWARIVVCWSLLF